MIPCQLTHVVIDESNDAQSLHIGEIDGDRHLVIGIGPMEAGAIDRAIRGERFARPLTHDLLLRLITHTGYRCTEIRIVKMEQGTYFADLILDGPEGEIAIDCRPSDALALFARVQGARLLVAEDLLTT